MEPLNEFFKQLNDERSGGTVEKGEVEFNPNDIVFQPDVDGNTPLHNSIRTNNTRVTDRLVQYLADTDFDNHIRYINRKIPKLV
jgi:ankyrin repeat protein